MELIENNLKADQIFLLVMGCLVCSECLEVHAQAGMMADCEAVQELLHELLPRVLQGKSVAELDRAWPQVARDISMHRFAWNRNQT